MTATINSQLCPKLKSCSAIRYESSNLEVKSIVLKKLEETNLPLILVKLALLNPGQGTQSNLGHDVGVARPAQVPVVARCGRLDEAVHHLAKLLHRQACITGGQPLTKPSGLGFLALDLAKVAAGAGM